MTSEISTSRLFYGYIVVLAAFLIVLIGWGSFFSFGVFFEHVLKEFNWTRAETSGAYSLGTLTTGFVAILMGKLNDRLGPKIVLSICCFFAGMGYMLMSLVSTIWHFYLFYGIVLAFGIGGFFVPPTSTVARWFVKRRTLMIGFVLLGANVGAMIIPPIAAWFIAHFGWRFTYILMGTVNLTAISLAQLLKRYPVQRGRHPYSTEGKIENESGLQSIGFSLHGAVRVRQFYLLCAIFFCFYFCINTMLTYTVIYATGLGISQSKAASVMLAFGGAGIAGRIVNGLLGDRIGNRQTCFVCFILISADMLYLTKVTDLSGLLAFSALIGFAFAGIGALMGPLTADAFGLKSHGLIFGIIYASNMLGGAVGPVMTGKLFDLTGSYHFGFLSCSVVGFMGSMLVLILGTGKRNHTHPG